MIESAALARRLGLGLHTHLAETVEEDAFCAELYGCRPTEYLEQLGWLGEDVWCAHCVHLPPADIATFARHGVGVAHCPTSNLRLGAGVAPVRDLLDAGVRVGLGVDGSASNERGDLFLEVKQALLVARGRGGPALSPPATPSASERAAVRPCSAAPTSGSSPPGCAQTSPCGPPTSSHSAARPIRSPVSSWPALTGSIGSSSAARRSFATAC